jgi:hypothetical protein
MGFQQSFIINLKFILGDSELGPSTIFILGGEKG